MFNGNLLCFDRPLLSSQLQGKVEIHQAALCYSSHRSGAAGEIPSTQWMDAADQRPIVLLLYTQLKECVLVVVGGGGGGLHKDASSGTEEETHLVF